MIESLFCVYVFIIIERGNLNFFYEILFLKVDI